MRNLRAAWRLARLMLAPRAARKIADSHEHHLIAAFERRYGEEPTARELELMKLGFVATIEGMT